MSNPKKNINIEKINIKKNILELTMEINENILSNAPLHLNHYAIQSYDWFMKIKATRGDATVSDNVRNAKYFWDYDKVSNDIEDTELVDK